MMVATDERRSRTAHIRPAHAWYAIIKAQAHTRGAQRPVILFIVCNVNALK